MSQSDTTRDEEEFERWFHHNIQQLNLGDSWHREQLYRAKELQPMALSIWRAGMAYEKARSAGLVSALQEVLSRYEALVVALRKQKRNLVLIHNNDDPLATVQNIRAEALVIASNIGYEIEAVNPWNISPAIKKATEALAKYNKQAK